MTWRKISNLIKWFIYALPIWVFFLTMILNTNVIIQGNAPNLMTIVNQFLIDNIELFKVDFLFNILSDIYALFNFGVMPTYIEWSAAYCSYLIMMHIGYIIYLVLVFILHWFENLIDRDFVK